MSAQATEISPAPSTKAGAFRRGLPGSVAWHLGSLAILAVICSISSRSLRISYKGPSARMANFFGWPGSSSRRSEDNVSFSRSNCSTVWVRIASLLFIASIARNLSAVRALHAHG